MAELLSSCSACIVAIALGYLSKALGVVSYEDRQTLNKIITHITLPCAIIQGVSSMRLDLELALIVAIGFFSALLMLLTANIVTRRRDPGDRTFCLISCGAYNVSCFTIPFIQTFVSPALLIFAFAFDAGNALMATNGAYVTTCSLTGEKNDGKSFFRRLISSIPFDTYVIMLVLSLLHLTIPKFLLTFTALPASANPFIAMFVIGVMLEFKFDVSSVCKTLLVVIIRLGFGAIMCMAVSRLGFLSAEVRKILCVCLFSPVSSMAPIFIDQMGGDSSLCSFTFTVSTIASITVMMFLLA